MKICEKCGFSADDSFDFCPKCGGKLGEQEKRNMKKCPKCGWEISVAADECPNCGYAFRELDADAENKNTTKKCPSCNQDISNTSTVCPNCGHNFLGVFGNNQLPKKKKNGCLISILVVCGFLLLISMFAGSDEDTGDSSTDKAREATSEKAEDNDNKENGADEAKKEESVKETEKPKKKELEKWEKEYKDSNIKYVNMKFLYKNAKWYQGNVIVTCGNIYDLSEREIKFDINSENFFMEVTCNLKNEDDSSGLKEGEKICFIGKLGDSNSFFGTETIDIDNCFVIARGKDTDSYEKKISKQNNNQKEYVSSAKKKQKEKKKRQTKNQKNKYMKQCKVYEYKKIQRKPKKYEGKKIKVSGTVIQVSEGWFDSVTLRVEDSNGNVWYVDYSYSDNEDKILEDDRVTIYGECTGTETYITVLGGTNTIPSVDGEYID